MALLYSRWKVLLREVWITRTCGWISRVDHAVFWLLWPPKLLTIAERVARRAPFVLVRDLRAVD